MGIDERMYFVLNRKRVLTFLVVQANEAYTVIGIVVLCLAFINFGYLCNNTKLLTYMQAYGQEIRQIITDLYLQQNMLISFRLSIYFYQKTIR